MTTSRRLAIVENKDREGLALPIGETPEGAIDWEFIEAMTVVSGPFTRRVVEMNAAPTDAEIEAMAEKLWDAFQEYEAEQTQLMLRERGWKTQVPTRIAWRELVDNPREHGMASPRNVNAFRAMARVALQPEENGDEVRG